jgi:hypothetical protein
MDHAKAVARMQEENHAAVQRSSNSMYHASRADRPSYMSQPSELGNLKNLRLPTDIAPVAFKYSMVLAFLASKLSEGSAPHSKQDINVWVELCSTGGQNSILYALAAIMFGQVHNSSGMVMEARQAYGKDISDLQVSLLGSKSNRSGSFDILSSVTALCMYEVSTYKKDRGNSDFHTTRTACGSSIRTCLEPPCRWIGPSNAKERSLGISTLPTPTCIS